MKKQLIQGALWLAILAALLVINALMMVSTESLLAPWSNIYLPPEPLQTFSEPVLPADGTWQALVNAFFGASPANMLPGLLVVLMALRYAFRAARQSTALLAQMLIGMLLFITASLSLSAVTDGLNALVFGAMPTNERYVLEIGYHRSLIPLLALLILVFAWGHWQRRVLQSAESNQATRKEKRKRQQADNQTQEQSAVQRLQTRRTTPAQVTPQSTRDTQQASN